VQASAVPQAARVDSARILAADQEPGQWLSYGRTYDEQHYSPLDQINDQNVSELGLAWSIDLPTNQPVESTPLFIDGVLYVASPWSRVRAVDARTGQVIWEYDPKVPGEWNVNVCCGPDLRGVAAWNGKIIFGTMDGRLIALNAKTGEKIWEIKATPDGWPYAITGAPRVANGKLYIGEAGGEFGVRGYMDCYDAETGKHLWRWWTVPGDPKLGFENPQMEKAAKTWSASSEWWNLGGGGPVWDGITYDPKTNLVMFGTGNASPWSATARDPGKGDNLYTSTIIALDADTGEYRWHYQTTPWDTWDYDAGQQLTIVDLELNGQMRHVVMQANKNGFFYMLDAKTGELLAAKAYTGMNWSTGVDMKTGRPIEVPAARFNVTDEDWNMLPGPAGAHGWQSMSWSPKTRLVYLPVTEQYWPFGPDKDFKPVKGSRNLGVALPGQKYYDAHPDAPHGTMASFEAWDPVKMQVVWKSEPRYTDAVGVQVTSGTLATGGNLVFHGNLPDKEFAAYRATDGAKLWSFDAQTPVMPGAISYEVDGVQYVAVTVGGPVDGGYYAPNYARLLVFKRGGTAKLPPTTTYVQPPIADVQQFASAEAVAHGEEIYTNNCALCHGGAVGRSTFPDLRRSAALYDQDVFDSIVLGGARAENGMGSFRGRLTEDDTKAIRGYVISLARQALAAPPAPAPALGMHGEAISAKKP
jgi:PQQ-dependent dehydrogenase (methanol/ethanol family)